MTLQQRETIERTLAELSMQDKRELVDQILRSMRTESSTLDHSGRQREALAQLCRKTDAMPVTTHDDGLANRDHDRLIYTR